MLQTLLTKKLASTGQTPPSQEIFENTSSPIYVCNNENTQKTVLVRQKRVNHYHHILSRFVVAPFWSDQPQSHIIHLHMYVTKLI